MPFMKHQMTDKQEGWQIETKYGTCFLPESVFPVPDWLRYDAALSSSDNEIFRDLASDLNDYVEGGEEAIIEISAIKDHYFARLSAPGYMDCTAWCAFRTLREARTYLNDI